MAKNDDLEPAYSTTAFLEIAKQIVKDHPEYFEGKLPKKQLDEIKKFGNKERYTFTIDKNIMLEFRKICDEKKDKMSGKIEGLVEEYIDKNRKAEKTVKDKTLRK